MDPWSIAIALILMIISAIITALTTKAPPRPADPTPAIISEFNLPQIAEGTPQVVVFGDVWLTDWQVLWYGDLRSDEIRKESGGGKK